MKPVAVKAETVFYDNKGPVSIGRSGQQKPVQQSKSDPKTFRIDGDIVDHVKRAVRAERCSMNDFVNKGLRACVTFSFEELDQMIRHQEILSLLVNDHDLLELLKRIVAKNF